jgi:RNA polymerase sigma-70 factor (ECF subfamily)
VGAYEELSTPPLPDAVRRARDVPHDHRAAEDHVQEAATAGWQRLQNLKPEHLLPTVVPPHRATKAQDSAAWSLGEVTRESMVDEQEPDLVQRALLGDAGAYEQILTPHLPMAWRLAYSVIHDRCGAEDCVQKAAERAWLRLENLQPGMPFRPWFLGIVVRQCQEYRRSRWVTAVRLVDPELLLRSNDDDWVERRLEGVELRRAFARLPRDQQVAVHLHLVEDLTQAETAVTMGISVSNVKAKIDRAKKRLRKALEEERGDDA